LICANCAAPVAEARCPACQAARAQFHHRTGFTIHLTVAAAAFLALLLLVLALQLAGVH
jgi:hypothetical protein